MLEILIYTFFLSISLFGEARAGMSYAIINVLPLAWTFTVGLEANLLIFPLLMWLIDSSSQRLWPNRISRRGVVTLFRRHKKVW